jgi:hypothetical protein
METNRPTTDNQPTDNRSIEIGETATMTLTTDATDATNATNATLTPAPYAMAVFARNRYYETRAILAIGTPAQVRETLTRRNYTPDEGYTIHIHDTCPDDPYALPADLDTGTAEYRYRVDVYPLYAVYTVHAPVDYDPDQPGDPIQFHDNLTYFPDPRPAIHAAQGHLWDHDQSTDPAMLHIYRHTLPPDCPGTLYHLVTRPARYVLRSDNGTDIASPDYIGSYACARIRAQSIADETRNPVQVWSVPRRYTDFGPMSHAIYGNPDTPVFEYTITPNPLPVALCPGYSVVPAHAVQTSQGDKSPLYTTETLEDAITYATRYYRDTPYTPAPDDHVTRPYLFIVSDWAYPPVATSVTRAVVGAPPAQCLGHYSILTGDLYETVESLHDSFDYCPVSRALYRVMHRIDTDVTIGGVNATLTPDGKLTYFPATRPVVNREYVYQPNPETAPGIVTAKLVKGLRAIFPDLTTRYALTDSDWEQFGNRVKALNTVPTDFAIVRGHDIARYYADDMKSPGAERHWSSCMTNDYDICTAYLALYTDNPDRVGLMIHTDVDGLLLARAIVWTSDAGETVVDRIYASDVIARAMSDYATGQGWILGFRTSHRWEVTLKNYDHDCYPYMDSLPYLHMGTGTLSAHQPARPYRVLRSTTGDYDDYRASYRVTFTRTVTETAYVDIEATDDDHARDIAEMYSQREITYHAVGADDSSEWEIDDIEEIDD